VVSPQNAFPEPQPVSSGNQAEGVIHAVIEKPISTRTSFVDRFADSGFKWLITLCAVSVLAIVALFVYELVVNSELSLKQFGLHFFFGSDWDPV
jgi:phosphate transport system permease protein